jgi:DNA polymerase-3 subunit beta
MTFKCELTGATFAAAVRRAAAVTPKGNSIPILGHLLLAGQGDTLEIAGTNMDQSLTVALPTSGAKGSLTAPAATLASIAQRVDDLDPLTLEQDGARLLVKRGRACWRLPTLPAEDFPAGVTQPIEGACWRPDAAALCERLRALEGAIDPNSARDYLQGVFFDLTPGAAHLVATDSFKLGATALDDLAPPDDIASFILPHDSLRVAADFDATEGPMEVVLSGHAVTLAAGGARFWTKLIAGDYPAWQRTFPAELPCEARLLAVELAAMLNRIGAVEGDMVQQGKAKARVTRVRLEVGRDEVVASTENSGGEAASDAAAATLDAGEPFAMTLNAAQLDWALASLPKTGELLLRSGPAAPAAVLTHAADSGNRSRRLLSLMRG